MPNGTDTSGSCASCVYAPLYYASAVLPDGRVVVVGGEYNGIAPPWTNIGFLYDPVADTWSSQLMVPFPTGRVGDIQTVVLDNGKMLIASIGTNIAEFNSATLTFTALNPINKLDNNNEENWNILPDGRVLTVDTRIASSFEIYDPELNTWTSGTTPVNLVDCCGAADGVDGSSEAGPGVLRPDGTLVYFSGNSTGQNAVYDTVAGTWTHRAAMDFPLVPGQTYHYAVADGPASLLPNGNVLVMASPVRNGLPFNRPSHFYEFDGTNLTQVTDTPNAASFTSYQGRMLLLPSGQVMLTAYDQLRTQDVLLYSNGGSPQDAWRPVIMSVPSTMTSGNTYTISGRLFNGFSEGATYGDDAAMSSNYPLVRIKNLATSHVVYARTHDHTSMGVELVSSIAVVSTRFDVPAGVEAGQSELVVVVNGIPSLPVSVNIDGGLDQVLNAELSGTPDPATFAFDPTPVQDGPAGTFSFTAAFCNIGAKPLILLKSVTTTLTGGNVLLNRDVGTPPGVGSAHRFPATQGFADGVLSAGECVDVPYLIGLATNTSFEFLVDGVGVAR